MADKTKPKSVLAWAVCDDGVPSLELVTDCHRRADRWRLYGWEVESVRITVVRERKKKATKRRAKR
jgi:hypothetical protein